MHPAGFDHAIPASERPQTHALESGAEGGGVGDVFVNHTEHKWELVSKMQNF